MYKTIFRYKNYQQMSEHTRLDIIDLRIMKLLSGNSRTHRNIASGVGIMPSALNSRYINGGSRSNSLLKV